MEDSLLLALEGIALAPFVWMVITRWERSDMKSSKVVLYPTPLLVRLTKWCFVGILLMLWLVAIADLLDR